MSCSTCDLMFLIKACVDTFVSVRTEHAITGLETPQALPNTF